MKKIFLIFGIILISFNSNAQLKYTAKVSLPDINQMQNMMERKKALYDYNKDYAKNLAVWIFELKKENTDEIFNNSLDRIYKELRNLDNLDYSLLTDKIKNIELEIYEEIDRYRTRNKETNDPNKYWKAANSDFEKELYFNAIANYNKVEKLAPDYAFTYIQRGLSYHYIGNYDAALVDYSKFISLEPNNSNGYFYRALIYIILQDYSKAILDFDFYIRLEPNNEEGYESRGWAKYNQKDYIGALQDFNKQIDLNGNSATAYYNRGSAKSALKDYYGSKNDYEKAILLNPNFPAAYNNIGWDLFIQGKYKEALPYIDKAILLDGKNIAAYDSRYEIYFALKNYEKCINDCLKTIELDSTYSNAYFILGRAYYRQGLKEKACISWSKAGENGKGEAYEYISKYCSN